MNYQFVKELISSSWQVDRGSLVYLRPFYRAVLSGVSFERKPIDSNCRQYFVFPDGKLASQGYYADDQESVPATDIQQDVPVINIIPLRNVLTKHDQPCGPEGTRTIAQRLIEADSQPNVVGHIIIIESPGGQSTAVAEMSDAIAQCTKPVISWVDGMAASAAYYIASYTSRIFASRDSDWIGSIGTMVTYEGRRSKSEANSMGEVSVTVYADDCDEKNEEYETAINDFNFKLVKENILNPINNEFKANVTANRPAIPKELLRGKCYFAKNVVGTMVDEIGPLSVAIKYILDLSKYEEKAPSQELTNNSIKNSFKMRQFQFINNALGIEALESSDEGVFLNEEQLTELNQRLESNQQLQVERDSAITDRETAVNDLTAAQASLGAAYNDIDAIDQSIAEAATPLEKAEAIRTLLAAKPATPPVQGLKPDENNVQEEDWDTLNNSPLNKLANQL